MVIARNKKYDNKETKIGHYICS